MCGICGIITFNGHPVQDQSIKKMMHLQKHRGPDDEGVFLETNIGFGFVRLSILDLSSSGHQPMHSADNRYVIVFNGEIFNYIELRQELTKLGHIFQTNTDTEVLLSAYIEWGEDCLNHFNGMWAFCIYDRKEKIVFASRDRYGIKPFYYLLTDSFIAFASEIPPLLTLIEGKPKPNNQVIFDYLVFNRTDQTEQTFFNEILKLQHGHSITFNTQSSSHQFRPSIKKWYNLKARVSNTIGFNNSSEYKELFSSAIGLRLRSDVPVGVCLSGGLDSSSIVSILLNDFNKSDLNTFSAIYQKGITGDESEYINIYKGVINYLHIISPTAESLQLDLNNFITAQAEPMPTTSPYAQYKLMELAKKHIVVTLDGQGADEQLAGYHDFFGYYFKDLLQKKQLFKLSSEIYHYLKIHRSLYAIKTFGYFLLPAKLKSFLRIHENNYLNKEYSDCYSNESIIASHLYGSGSLNDALINHFEYKLEHLLKWSDRNSMHYSIESRVPFLDFRLVEKTLASKSDFIINKGVTKVILREAMKGFLFEKIRTRQDKIGFSTPQKDWFRTSEWKNLIINILQSDSFKSRGIIDQKKALNLFNIHLLEKKDLSKEIWKMINLELWFRLFIDEKN